MVDGKARQRDEQELKAQALGVISVHQRSFEPIGQNKRAQKPHHALAFKKEQRLTIGDVIAEGFVATEPLHVAGLAFAGVHINAVVISPTILIAITATRGV